MAKSRRYSNADSDDQFAGPAKKFSWEGLKKTLRIFRYTLPYKGIFSIGFVFLILSTATSLAFPKLVGSIVEVIEGKSTFTINQIVIALFAILIAQSFFSFFRIYTFARVSERAMADVRKDVFSKIITLPIGFLEQRRVGELTSRITSDVTQLQDVLSFTIAELFRQMATLVVGVVLISYTSWKLTVFMLATFPLLVISAMVFGRYIRKLSKKAQDELALSNVIVEETLQSVQVVKAFTNEHLEVIRYQTALGKVVENALKAATFRGTFVSFIIFALSGGIVGVIWYGASLVQTGELSIADLFTFTLYTAFIGGAIGGMGDIFAQINKSIGASERILEIMEESSEINLSSASQSPPPIQPNHISGAVSYENVRFSYPSRPDVPVLKNISFSIEKGEKIALVGYSGAGKSTIVQLLLRFYQPQGGRISIDGQAINEFDLTALRENIAVVPQEVILFGGTIFENISYGKPGASQEEVREAARKANALDFIDSFPEGMATLVGERGIKLSGGQRQRIAIARAILKDPKILILDEATSSLDAESELQVQQALDELMQNRTSIIIAHRLATIRKVDTIYVIRDGQIAEKGPHNELSILPNGLYASLIKLQFDSQESSSPLNL